MTTVRVDVADTVREQIYDHVFGTLDREVGGVLLGRAGVAVVEVTAALAALEAESREASVTFTHETWSSIYERMERDHPGLEIVGWYHSHPGFGIFLSDLDLFIHRSFFAGAGQVAYVVDPRGGTEGIFGWDGGEITSLVERPTGRPAASTAGVAPEEDAAPGVVAADRRGGGRRRPIVLPTLAVGLVGVLAGAAGGATLFEGNAPATDRPAATAPRSAPSAQVAAAERRADDLQAKLDRLKSRREQRARPPRPLHHVVRRGETASALAERFYGDPDAYWLIAGASRLTNPDRLAVGARLTIPRGVLRTTTDRRSH